jgi:hypothetical protein
MSISHFLIAILCMAWLVITVPAAEADLKKIDRSIAKVQFSESFGQIT